MIGPLHKLSPSFVRHASTAAMLRRFSAHASFHVTTLSPPSPLSRASTRNDPRHSYVASFSCGRRLCRASRSPRQDNPHVHPPAMRDVSRSAVTIALSPPSFMMTSIPSNGPRFGASITHHQLPFPPYAAALRIIKSVDHQGFCLRSSLPLPPSLPFLLPSSHNHKHAPQAPKSAPASQWEMMMHHNWAVRRWLEATTGSEERRNIVACAHSGRSVDHATNCYGYYVLQKALDCEEDEVCLLIVSELLRGDPAPTLVGKHVSHAWSKVRVVCILSNLYPSSSTPSFALALPFNPLPLFPPRLLLLRYILTLHFHPLDRRSFHRPRFITELSWTSPAPQIFAQSLHLLFSSTLILALLCPAATSTSTASRPRLHNLEESAKDGIVDELLGQVGTVFGEVAKSYPRTRLEKHRQMALEHLLPGLLEFATTEQDSQNALTILKEGRKEMIDRVVQRMCEPAKGARRAMIADKNQRAALYDCIRGHIVTLRGCKTGSKVIWLFDRMHAYYGLFVHFASLT
ncbi:hypothetical protein B0H13DRAFT_2337868 [Mycena leptocephala]|nr:hypothetical protein B0H13DRAFT_2337868 [Mycena leptocephala]